MKSFALVLVAAGLASALRGPSAVAVQGGQVNVNNNGSAVDGAGARAGNVSSIDPNAIAGGVNLGNMNVGGVNLGSVNLNNQNDVANAIGLMLNALCLGGSLDASSILNLGSRADLEMFLGLAELLQLQQSNLINLSQIQNLFGSNQLFGKFNLGVFNRALAEEKKVIRSAGKSRRVIPRRQRKNQAQDCAAITGAVQQPAATETADRAAKETADRAGKEAGDRAATKTTAVATESAAVATESATVATEETSAVQTDAASATADAAAEATADSNEKLSDFTR